MVDWRTTDRATVTVTVESIAGTGRDGEVAIKGIVEGVSPQNHAVPLYLPAGSAPVAGSTYHAVIAKGRFNPKKTVNGEIPPGAPTWDWFYDCVAWDVDPGQQAPPVVSKAPAQPRNAGPATTAPLAESNSTKDSIELGNTKAAASRMFAGLAAVTGEVPTPEDFARYVHKVHTAVHGGSATEAAPAPVPIRNAEGEIVTHQTLPDNAAAMFDALGNAPGTAAAAQEQEERPW